MICILMNVKLLQGFNFNNKIFVFKRKSLFLNNFINLCRPFYLNNDIKIDLAAATNATKNRTFIITILLH